LEAGLEGLAGFHPFDAVRKVELGARFDGLQIFRRQVHLFVDEKDIKPSKEVGSKHTPKCASRPRIHVHTAYFRPYLNDSRAVVGYAEAAVGEDKLVRVLVGLAFTLVLLPHHAPNRQVVQVHLVPDSEGKRA